MLRYGTLAEANGLQAEASLIEGLRLTVPASVTRSSYNAETLKLYDANDIIGNVSPTTPKPKKNNKCGTFGQILLAAVAIAVVALIAPPLVGQAGLTVAGGTVTTAAGPLALSSLTVAGTGLSASLGAVGGAIAGGAIAGAAGSIVSQAVGVATGIQSKFSWTGVAAAGIGAGVGSFAASQTPLLGRFGGGMVSGTAAAMANAATRSTLSGTSFGDNILRALPDAIGSTIGNMVASQIAESANPRSRTGLIAAAGDTVGVISDIGSPSDRANANALREMQEAGLEVTVTDDSAERHGLGWKVADVLGFHEGGLIYNAFHPSTWSAGGSNFVVTYSQASAWTRAGHDIMGQPLNGRSNYNAGTQFSNIIFDAGNVSLGTTLRRLGEWSTYTVPDAARLNAEIWDPHRDMTSEGRVVGMQMARLTGGTISGIATGVSIELGADLRTQDLMYGFGSSVDGFLIVGGSMAGCPAAGHRQST